MKYYLLDPKDKIQKGDHIAHLWGTGSGECGFAWCGVDTAEIGQECGDNRIVRRKETNCRVVINGKPVAGGLAEKVISFQCLNDVAHLNQVIDAVYLNYPTKDPKTGRTIAKGQKAKDKLLKLMETRSVRDIYLIQKKYIDNCMETNTFVMNYATFLNNLPLPEDLKEQDDGTEMVR